MKFFGFFKKKEQTDRTPPPEEPSLGGHIGYYKLESWWLQDLNYLERQNIIQQFNPIGGSSITEGSITYSSASVIDFLSGLAGWFEKPENVSIAMKALTYADSISGGAKALDRHFLYQQMVKTYYKFRSNEEHLNTAIAACRKQISIAPQAAKCFLKEFGSPLPSHKGYEQLAIILWDQGKAEEAIAICAQARQQGWVGDWERRIERYSKGLAT